MSHSYVSVCVHMYAPEMLFDVWLPVYKLNICMCYLPCI